MEIEILFIRNPFKNTNRTQKKTNSHIINLFALLIFLIYFLKDKMRLSATFIEVFYILKDTR